MEVRERQRWSGQAFVEPALHRSLRHSCRSHLLRELIAADARVDGASDETAARADALLGAPRGLGELTEGAIVRIEPRTDPVPVSRCAAFLITRARSLEGARRTQRAAGTVAARARSRRAPRPVPDRTHARAMMPALRDGNPDIECAVIVPLAIVACRSACCCRGARQENQRAIRALAPVAFRRSACCSRRDAATRRPCPAGGDARVRGGRRALPVRDRGNDCASRRGARGGEVARGRASSAEPRCAPRSRAPARASRSSKRSASAAAPARAREPELEALYGGGAHHRGAREPRRGAGARGDAAARARGAPRRRATSQLEGRRGLDRGRPARREPGTAPSEAGRAEPGDDHRARGERRRGAPARSRRPRQPRSTGRGSRRTPPTTAPSSDGEDGPRSATKASRSSRSRSTSWADAADDDGEAPQIEDDPHVVTLAGRARRSPRGAARRRTAGSAGAR